MSFMALKDFLLLKGAFINLFGHLFCSKTTLKNTRAATEDIYFTLNLCLKSGQKLWTMPIIVWRIHTFIIKCNIFYLTNSPKLKDKELMILQNKEIITFEKLKYLTSFTWQTMINQLRSSAIGSSLLIWSFHNIKYWLMQL